MSKLQDAEDQLHKFLEDNPNLLPFQEALQRELDLITGHSEEELAYNRLQLIKQYVIDNIHKLNETFIELQENIKTVEALSEEIKKNN